MSTEIMEQKVNHLSQSQQRQSMIDVASSRAAQEVQAAMVIAKRCPRDVTAARLKIITACKRPLLAEQSMYSYPRGGQNVTGPSIRLAEELARDWGNIDFGIVELEQKNGESIMQAYAWDLETNTRQTRIFTIKHMRFTKQGSYKLEDSRDIYEMTANQGARRLRACILGVIPGDIVEEAMRQCEATISGGSKEPIQDRVFKMISAFSEIGVTKDMIEKRLGHKTEQIVEKELLDLRKIFMSIRDNVADRSEYFDVGGNDSGKSATDRLADRLGKKAEDKQDSPSEPQTTVQPNYELTGESDVAN
jgi:hypothetical protein